MKTGDEVRVKLIERISEKKARVVDVEGGNPGTLLIKGKLRMKSDGTVNAWVIQHARDGKHTYGNAYFGKFTISRSIADRYVAILRMLFDNPEALTPDDVSVLKGMANRCVKRDQWDWFTTYKYLGYPAHRLLTRFVSDAVTQRDLLKQGRYDGLPSFKAVHHNLLRSMLFHLTEDVEIDDDEAAEVPVPGFDHSLWVRMSLESRRNIKMAERIHAKSSLFTLMHYFVALEQEFRSNFVEPFVNTQGRPLLGLNCLEDRYQRTHDVLTGKSPFTLGTVRFLGKFVGDERACNSSEAIQQFSDFLGETKIEFAAVCSLISSQPIGGVALPELRNALAHGNESVISRLDGATFDGVRSLLFDPPRQVMARILSNSPRSSTSSEASGR